METHLLHPFDELKAGRWKTISLAVALTLFIHIAVILLLPKRIMTAQSGKTQEEGVVYEIALVEPTEMKFVEANPDAPENEPDRKDQYSFRAQQAADDSPLSDDSDVPKIDGEEESQKIVQGQITQAQPLPPGVDSPAARPGEGDGTDGGKLGAQVQPAVALIQKLPPPAFIQQEPVAPEGPGSSLKVVSDAPEVFEKPDPNAPINVFRPQAQVQPEVQQGDGLGGAVDARPGPRERPRLAPELITGPLLKSQRSVNRRGALALDATFSEFGEYEQQFYATIQAGWYQEIEFFQPIDTSTRVHVRFRIKSDGTVDNVKAVKTTASKLATTICVTAITKRSPFRPWTKEMVEVFGEERWLNVVFHYR